MLTPRPGFRPPCGGFTLVELLSVIAIVGLLAGLLIPVIGRVRDSARTTQCLSNLRQIGLAIRLHANENRGEIPMVWTTGDQTPWQARLQPYIEVARLRDLFNCPAADPQPVVGTGQTTYAMSRFIRATPVERKFAQVPAAPLLMVVDIITANTDEVFPWNHSGNSASFREKAFRHGGGRRQNGVFTDSSVESMEPLRAGAFSGTGNTPNAWVCAGMSYVGNGFSPNPSAPTNELK